MKTRNYGKPALIGFFAVVIFVSAVVAAMLHQIAAVITVCLGVESTGDISNLPSVVTGIVLILASLIFRYGAELEQRSCSQITGEDQKR